MTKERPKATERNVKTMERRFVGTPLADSRTGKIPKNLKNRKSKDEDELVLAILVGMAKREYFPYENGAM